MTDGLQDELRSMKATLAELRVELSVLEAAAWADGELDDTEKFDIQQLSDIIKMAEGQRDRLELAVEEEEELQMASERLEEEEAMQMAFGVEEEEEVMQMASEIEEEEEVMQMASYDPDAELDDELQDIFDDIEEAANEAVDAAEKAANGVVDAAEKAANEAAQEVEDAANEAVDATERAANEAAQAAEDAANEVVESAERAANEATQAAEDAANEAAEGGSASSASASVAKDISGSVGRGGKNAGQDVMTVQQLLNRNGENLATDGLIGPKTIGAITKFQKANLGFGDGRVDPGGQTWGALSGSGNDMDGGEGDDAIIDAANEAIGVVEDVINESIDAVEEATGVEAGPFVDAANEAIGVVENAANKTIDAVEDALNEAADAAEGTGTPGESEKQDEFVPPTEVNEPTLRKGDDNVDGWVEYLQNMLNHHLGTGTVSVNGKFDQKTHSAVTQFQSTREPPLMVDGVVGNQTWSVLRKDPQRAEVGTDGRDPNTFVEKGPEGRWGTEDKNILTYDRGSDELRLVAMSVGDEGIDDFSADVFINGKRRTIKIGKPEIKSSTGAGHAHWVRVTEFTGKHGNGPYKIEAFLPQELGGDKWTTDLDELPGGGGNSRGSALTVDVATEDGTEDDGEPIEGAEVTVMGGGPEGMDSLSAMTNARGQIKFDDLEDGNYVVTVIAQNDSQSVDVKIDGRDQSVIMFFLPEE